MRNLLVTGGAGFIGSNFVHYWLKHHPGDRVIVLDALTYAGNLANLKAAVNLERFRFVHGNLSDEALLNQLMRDEQVNYIVHFAAESHVDNSISNPDIFIKTNIEGTHHLLKAAKKAWLDSDTAPSHCRFHHVSTDEVYGSLGPNDAPFSETTPYAPNSPYAASKAAADHLVRAYHQTYGLPITISNCSNNYGPYQYPEKLIPLFIINALNGKPLTLYGDGQNIRDWLGVENHCQVLDKIIHDGVVGEVYNVGGNNEQSNVNVVSLLCSLLNLFFKDDPSLKTRFPDSPAAKGKTVESLITYVDDRLGHDRRYAINANKVKTELGCDIQEDMELGLRQTIRWYLENEGWWQQLQTEKERNNYA